MRFLPFLGDVGFLGRRNIGAVMHPAMAQGGRIEITRNDNRKIETVSCFTRDGWVYPGFGMRTLEKLGAF